ncbi:MAG TPA: TrkA C-terminal domain-containing protein [Actinoplanes sp.]|nr:TrkA C-terminal domain-containing protein [Actinoplanes sp.]
MRIERTLLPGAGINHTASTAAGQRFGVVARRNGCRDIVVYDAADPERVACALHFAPDEAHQVADLLNATVTIDHIGALERPVDGITAARIRLPVGSPYHGRPLAEARASRTGASVVAVVRGPQVTTAPGPGFVLCHDDTVVVVGDRDGVGVLTDLLTRRAAEGP